GRRNSHLPEEHIGKFLVVMLARVNKNRLDTVMLGHFIHERRNLHQVRSCADNVKNHYWIGHRVVAKTSIAFKFFVLSVNAKFVASVLPKLHSLRPTNTTPLFVLFRSPNVNL